MNSVNFFLFRSSCKHLRGHIDFKIRMKNLKIVLIISILNVVTLAPAYAFEDPSVLMPQLDRFLENRRFSDSFRQGDTFQLIRTNCEKLTNGCSKMTSRYEVLSASAEKGEVATFIGNRNSPSSIAKVTRRQWEEIAGNMARNVVREIESYGARVTLTGLRELRASTTINGQATDFPAMELSFVYKPTVGPMAHQQLVLTPGLRGPGQIVRRFTDDGVGSHTTLELSGCNLTP